jgi:hypothetical protein
MNRLFHLLRPRSGLGPNTALTNWQRSMSNLTTLNLAIDSRVTDLDVPEYKKAARCMEPGRYRDELPFARTIDEIFIVSEVLPNPRRVNHDDGGIRLRRTRWKRVTSRCYGSFWMIGAH